MTDLFIINDDPRLNRRNAALDYFTDASTLGLPPGQWPGRIATELGNRQPFVFVRLVNDGDSASAAIYRQLCGCVNLTVFND